MLIATNLDKFLYIWPCWCGLLVFNGTFAQHRNMHLFHGKSWVIHITMYIYSVAITTL